MAEAGATGGEATVCHGRRPEGADRFGRGAHAHVRDERNHDALDSDKRRAGRSNDGVKALLFRKIGTLSLRRCTQLFAVRDSVVRAFSDLYRNQVQEFPTGCREADYERRLQAAYPIHPELFDRLYIDWSSLDKFRRTRGVLRLMAAVIHALWERQDAGLMILPASVPFDEPPVQFELTRYMEDPRVPVIEKDVDGPASLPLRLDRENPNLGRYSACRRVARTVYLGSAPTLHTANKGLEDRQIKLGCVQPGEGLATFGDALRRLTDEATHLYIDGKRYWFSTQQSVTRLAQDRAARSRRLLRTTARTPGPRIPRLQRRGLFPLGRSPLGDKGGVAGQPAMGRGPAAPCRRACRRDRRAAHECRDGLGLARGRSHTHPEGEKRRVRRAGLSSRWSAQVAAADGLAQVLPAPDDSGKIGGKIGGVARQGEGIAAAYKT
jgi:hypothetical protein